MHQNHTRTRCARWRMAGTGLDTPAIPRHGRRRRLFFIFRYGCRRPSQCIDKPNPLLIRTRNSGWEFNLQQGAGLAAQRETARPEGTRRERRSLFREKQVERKASPCAFLEEHAHQIGHVTLAQTTTTNLSCIRQKAWRSQSIHWITDPVKIFMKEAREHGERG